VWECCCSPQCKPSSLRLAISSFPEIFTPTADGMCRLIAMQKIPSGPSQQNRIELASRETSNSIYNSQDSAGGRGRPTSSERNTKHRLVSYISRYIPRVQENTIQASTFNSATPFRSFLHTGIKDSFYLGRREHHRVAATHCVAISKIGKP
jgi:hypothetical protein